MKNSMLKHIDGKDYGLTPREQDVLALAVQGLNRPQIAAQLGLQPLTIGTHMKKIHRKLGVHTRAAAVAMVLKQGLLEAGQNRLQPRHQRNVWRGELASSGRKVCQHCGLTFA